MLHSRIMPVPFMVPLFELISEDDEWSALNQRLLNEGFSSSLPSETKLLCVWRWLVDAEQNLHSSRKMHEKLRAQHAQEMQEVEMFVETLKDITDQRVSKVEEEKKKVEQELHKLKSNNNVINDSDALEIREMLKKEGLGGIIHSSTSEQVAYLLVERSRLLEEIVIERENNENNRTTSNLTDTIKLGSSQIQQLLDQQKADFEEEMRLLEITHERSKDKIKIGHEHEVQTLTKDLNTMRKRIQEMSTGDPSSRFDSLQSHCEELESKVSELSDRNKMMERAMRQLENENETLMYKLSEALAECDEKESMLRKKNSNTRRRSSVGFSPRETSTVDSSESPKRLHQLLDNKINTAQQEITWLDQIRKLQSEVESLQQQLVKATKEHEVVQTKYQRRKSHDRTNIQKLRDQLNQERNSLKTKHSDSEREIVRLKSCLEKEKSHSERLMGDLKSMLDENRTLSNKLLEMEESFNDRTRTITLLNMKINSLENENSRKRIAKSTLHSSSYRQKMMSSFVKKSASMDDGFGKPAGDDDDSFLLLDRLADLLTTVQETLTSSRHRPRRAASEDSLLTPPVLPLASAASPDLVRRKPARSSSLTDVSTVLDKSLKASGRRGCEGESAVDWLNVSNYKETEELKDKVVGVSCDEGTGATSEMVSGPIDTVIDESDKVCAKFSDKVVDSGNSKELEEKLNLLKTNISKMKRELSKDE